MRNSAVDRSERDHQKEGGLKTKAYSSPEYLASIVLSWADARLFRSTSRSVDLPVRSLSGRVDQ